MILHPVLQIIPQEKSLNGPERVKRQREYARRALGVCAQKCGAPVEGWRQTDQRVPLPNRNWHWSISHKPQWAAAVIAGQPVGIDIEHIRPRIEGLDQKIASDREWDVVEGRDLQRFFRVWTAKEATLKANGVGISGLNECHIVSVIDDLHLELDFGGRRWVVEHFLLEDHLAAVTLGGHPVEWHVETA